MKEVKNSFLLDIVSLLKKGLNPSKIAIHLNISKQNLSYYLSYLKKENIIKKVGYGVWQVNPQEEVKILSHKGKPQVKEIRGHAFIWKIKSNKSFNWLNLLKNQRYEQKGITKTPRVMIGNRKVWLGRNYITIFEPSCNSFFGTNSIESKKQAILSMIDTIEQLKRTLNIEFNYRFTCRRQHYGLINSQEARQFISQGKRITIKNDKGYWFSIDFSQNKYQEAETMHEETADIDSLGYQKLMNSHKETNFKVTPDFILNTMNGIQQNQLIFDKNMTSHLNILSKLGIAVDELRKEVKKLGNKYKQTRLSEF